MNLELLNQFGQCYPETADGTLDCVSVAVTCAFNKFGTLLAVGCNDGRIYIWDFLTRGIAKVLFAHVHPVCSLSWSRNGRLLLSASANENTVCLTEVLTGQVIRCYRFPVPVTRVQINPRHSDQFLICLHKHPAILMTASKDGNYKLIPLREEVAAQQAGEHSTASTTAVPDTSIIAGFDRRGRHVYTGNGRGQMLVVKIGLVDRALVNLEPVASFSISAVASAVSVVKAIEFPSRGGALLVNSADRIIRIYESAEVLACGLGGEPEPLQRLQDNVNRTLWKRAVFSGDGEYVCGGSARQHSLYVWERASGTLVKILHGTKGELLLDVAWHPFRPVIAAVASGVVSVWAQSQVENWSAFAPDFKELDENVEYEERESEFDLYDEDKDRQAAAAMKNGLNGHDSADSELDVVTVDPVAAYLSSDDEDDVEDKLMDTDAPPNHLAQVFGLRDSLLFLPVAPEVDDPEEAPICSLEPSVPQSTVDVALSSVKIGDSPGGTGAVAAKGGAKGGGVAGGTRSSAAAAKGGRGQSSGYVSKRQRAALDTD